MKKILFIVALLFVLISGAAAQGKEFNSIIDKMQANANAEMGFVWILMPLIEQADSTTLLAHLEDYRYFGNYLDSTADAVKSMSLDNKQKARFNLNYFACQQRHEEYRQTLLAAFDNYKKRAQTKQLTDLALSLFEYLVASQFPLVSEFLK